MVLSLVEHACQREARSAALELRKRLVVLATVAASAAFVGLVGNVWGIHNSFIGCVGPKSYCMGVFAELITQSVVWNACGLLVAIASYSAHAHFTRRLDECENEMEVATKDLLQALSNRRAFPA